MYNDFTISQLLFCATPESRQSPICDIMRTQTATHITPTPRIIIIIFIIVHVASK